MKRTLLTVLALLFVASTANAAMTNLGVDREVVFNGHVLTEPTGGPRVLYCPSEGDDAAFRSAIATAIGGTCDYYDARNGVPDLSSYNCAMVWANYAFFDNVAMGNALADMVDAGGSVVLGAFCAYTSGNFLSGRIMTDTARYCPVVGGFNKFTFGVWSGDGASDCLHTGVRSYGATYRDILTLVAGSTIGTFTDFNISVATNADRDVVYANGAGGFPIDGNGPDWPVLVANGCLCSGPIATENTTWGAVKGLYR
jgi:hypothetical protein